MKQETREDTLQEILSLKGNNFLFEMTTGYGKSRLAIEKVRQNYDNTHEKILIVVHRKVHIKNWEDELRKWWPEDKGYQIGFVTYMSFPKGFEDNNYKWIIFDECHHLSQRCLDALDVYKFKGAILLSATVNKNLKYELKQHFHNLQIKTVRLREAIDNEVLPDPRVYLIPLQLDNNTRSYEIIKNPKAKGTPIICNYEGRWQYSKVKDKKVIIRCTQKQYILNLNSEIEWYKRKYNCTRNQLFKNRWLKLCGDRLKALSLFKTYIVRDMLHSLWNRRVLTFCCSIEQTKVLGMNCINSENKLSSEILQKFNEKLIKHITACNMLNEGVNLIDCEIGIYANLNSSETIVAQRAGRLLRHPKPIIIIPYYAGTREEELVKKMLDNYNPELIKTINNITEIR